MIKNIERDERGAITEGCMADMLASLPIKVYVNDDKEAHKVINTEKELNEYFKGALPYVLTTRYEQTFGGKEMKVEDLRKAEIESFKKDLENLITEHEDALNALGMGIEINGGIRRRHYKKNNYAISRELAYTITETQDWYD